MPNVDHQLWAEREFRRAQLGDKRRQRRLVRMAATAAATPAGRVTEQFAEGAEREAAYRFLENDDVDAAEMARAAHQATSNRCFEHEVVYVPVDGTSLNLRDRIDRRGLGIICTPVGARGLQVMTAIAVQRDGTPVGVCGQRYWVRRERSGRQPGAYDHRPLEQRETQRWFEVMAQARAAFRAEASQTRPWFQLDRGGDSGPILADAMDRGEWLTVRACANRRLAANADGKRPLLWDRLRTCEPLGSYALRIPVGEKRSARTACIQVQSCPVVLDLHDRTTGKHTELRVWAIRVIEVGTTPRKESAIDWVLLTTFPVDDLQSAMRVVDGYTSRWRIEEFHKTWKTGACEVENNQLQSLDHIVRFAVISASVAMRIQRLTHLARTSPDDAATIEFSRAEIDATILLREPKNFTRGDTPTVGEVVRWIADLGGFMGPSPKNKTATRKPGAIVIGRGLDRIEPVVFLLARGKM